MKWRKLLLLIVFFLGGCGSRGCSQPKLPVSPETIIPVRYKGCTLLDRNNDRDIDRCTLRFI